nr:reverse transcriptase domain-containing protein [Tanacetum cinerariifolium]
MRTRSSNLPVVSPPNPSTSNPKRHNRRSSKQPFILEESPIDTMVDQHTMAELLSAPTEGYAEAIVVPSILAEQFELKHSLINMMTSDQFFGLEKDNPHDHIRWGSPPVARKRTPAFYSHLGGSFNQQTSVVTTAMTAILKQFQATPPPASVKAVEEIYPSGNPTFSSHPELILPEVQNDIFNSEGGNVLPEKFLDLESTKDLHPPLHVNPLSSSTTSSPSQLLEELVDELSHNFVDSMPEMFTDEHAPDYSSPLIFDEYDDDFLEVESDAENFYDDPFDSKGEKIKDLAEYTIKVPPPLVQKSKPPSQIDFVMHQRDPLHPNIPYPSRMLKQKQQEKDKPSGNLTFSSHPELTSPEVKDDIFDPEGDNVLPKKFLDLDSTNDLHPLLHVNPLSGSTTSSLSPNQFLEEFADELALITFPPGNDDLYNLADNLVDSMPEMFTDKHALDYSSPPLYDEYDDDLFEVESNTESVYDDPFDSKAEKIKESKLLIDELDLPCDFLFPSEYDSFLSEDFSEVDALPSTNNEDKVFNPGILIQENHFEIITRVVQDKKLAISNASLMLEDFDPPLYELPFFKEVPRSKMLLPFSSENEEK